jgi:adenylate kinase
MGGNNHMRLVLLGPPGAGKGTQAEILGRRLSVPVISTGNMLRTAVKNGTAVGLKAKSYMDAGELVPDSVIIELTRERIGEPDCEGGYILDGVPRTLPQAQALEDCGVLVDTALSIEMGDAEIEARMTGRRYCPNCGATYHIVSNPPKAEGVCDGCGAQLEIRSDDAPETVRNRLEVYHRETEPLKEYYGSRGKLKTVGNVAGIEAMTAVILGVLDI